MGIRIHRRTQKSPHGNGQAVQGNCAFKWERGVGMWSHFAMVKALTYNIEPSKHQNKEGLSFTLALIKTSGSIATKYEIFVPAP